MTTVTLPERKWATDEPAEREPHPDPEVRARKATPEELSGSAKTWIKRAEAAGWRVVPTYARGTTVDNKGNPTHLVHSLALRMIHPETEHRVVVVWTARVYDDAGKRYEVGEVKAITGVRAGWDVAAYAWTPGDEFPLAIGLAASKKEPDRETLAAYLITPAPRRFFVELRAQSEVVKPSKE